MSYLKSALWNLSNCKIPTPRQKKCLDLGPKTPYLGTFRLEFEKNYCLVWNQHPQICLSTKFREKNKTKMPKFGTKNALFGYFWARIWKSYCRIWNQHFRISQKPLTHTVNFGIGSAFSKGPGPGPLYKLCPLTGAQLGWRGEVYPALSENRKKGLDFWKKGLNCNHLWVNFSIQNVALRVSRRKNCKMFSCGASFSGVSDKIFLVVL